MGIAYWPGITAAGTAPRWAAIAIGGSLLSLSMRFRPSPAHWVGLAFLCYGALSFLWTDSPWDTLNSLIQWSFLGLIFCIGAETKSLDKVFSSCALAVSVSALIGIVQFSNPDWIGQYIGVSSTPAQGLFVNKNFFGEFSALTLVGIVITRQWRWFIPCLSGLVMSSCRAAVLGTSIAALVFLWRRSKSLAIVAATVVLVFGAMYSHRPGAIRDVINRAGIWEDTLGNLKPFGHGLGTFYVASSQSAPYQKALQVRHAHAHNDFIEQIFELGVGAVFLPILAFVCLALPVARRPDEAAILLVAGIAIGMVAFPLENPATGFLMALCAGHLAGTGNRNLDYIRDIVDRRTNHKRSGFGPCFPR